MAIILHQKKDFRGGTTSVTADTATLKDSGAGKHPSSLELTGADDAALFFKRDDFKGECMFRRGPLSIADLGSKKAGGKLGFGNSVASVRVTPFTLPLNVTMVSTADLKLPGGFVKPARTQVDAIVALANSRLDALSALLVLRVDGFNVRQSDRKFDVDRPRVAAYPPAWKELGQLDVVIANSARVQGEAGVAKPPCLGQVVLLVARQSFVNPISGATQSVNLAVDMMAMVLLHEMGHYLGVHHPSGKKSQTNIMSTQALFDPFSGALSDPVFTDLVFSQDQIENMQSALSRNPARRADRRK